MLTEEEKNLQLRAAVAKIAANATEMHYEMKKNGSLDITKLANVENAVAKINRLLFTRS